MKLAWIKRNQKTCLWNFCACAVKVGLKAPKSCLCNIISSISVVRGTRMKMVVIADFRNKPVLSVFEENMTKKQMRYTIA